MTAGRRTFPKSLVVAAFLVAVSANVLAAQDGDAPPAYLARAHAHNDYERSVPLHDALGRGFASIEVDIVLQGNELYVAHEESEVRAGVTLRALYLDPLRQLVRMHGGWLFSQPGTTLQLLIDVKTEAVSAYRALDAALAEYDDLFTRWSEGAPEHGPVTAVLSGNRAVELVRATPVRRIAVDGRIDEPRDVPPEVMPMVSIDWEMVEAPTLAGRLARARELTDIVRGEGRKIRFWGTPDSPELWAGLLGAGVDYLGTDEPERLEPFLRERSR